MKSQFIIFLAAVTFTAAMVPKLRRAVNLEEELRQSMASSVSPVANKDSTAASTPEVCKPTTPCAWSIYVNKQKIIDTNITNTYCNCEDGTECQYDEDDENINAFIHRCKPPKHNEDKMES